MPSFTVIRVQKHGLISRGCSGTGWRLVWRLLERAFPTAVGRVLCLGQGRIARPSLRGALAGLQRERGPRVLGRTWRPGLRG